MLKLIARSALGVVALLTVVDVAMAQEPTTRNVEAPYSLLNPMPRDELLEMVTDRPDRAESPFTVEPGHLQIESGLITYVHDDDDDAGELSEWRVGQTNLRLGVLPDFEISLAVEPYIRQRIENGTTATNEGYGLTTLSLRHTLWGSPGDTQPGSSAAGLMVQFDFPTGDDDLDLEVEDEVRYALLVPYQINLTENLILAEMPGVRAAPEDTDDGYDLELLNAVNLSYSLTQNLQTYAEFWAEVNVEESSDWIGTTNLGVMYQLSDNLQIDAAVNIGVTDEADDLETTLGLSLRI